MSKNFAQKVLMFVDTASNIVTKATDGIQNVAARAVVRGTSAVASVGGGLGMLANGYNDAAASVEPMISQAQSWNDIMLMVGGAALSFIGARAGSAALDDFREYQSGLVERKPTPSAADLRNQGQPPANTLR